MASDCTVKIDSGLLNVRVGAIIRRGEKLLMVTSKHTDYYYTVGGRIQFGETAEEAIVREVMEETGYHMEIDHLGFIHENLFYGDLEPNKGSLFYEIAFYFYMKVPEDFEPVCNCPNIVQHDEYLCWVTPDEKKTIYPKFFRQKLSDSERTVQHIVTDDRRIQERLGVLAAAWPSTK